jgi:hypothetical protein
MKLSQKKRNFIDNIKVGVLLVICVLTGPGLILFNVQGLNLPRVASASSYQINASELLKPFDHIILTWAGNPATTQAVTWRSLVDAENSVAEIAPAKASPDFVKDARRISAVTSSLKFNDKYNYYHSVNFTGLDPDTLYVYRVGNGIIWSEWFQFRTAGINAEPFSFLYFGDAQVMSGSAPPAGFLPPYPASRPWAIMNTKNTRINPAPFLNSGGRSSPCRKMAYLDWRKRITA